MLSQGVAVPASRLIAVEFLASVRSSLKFFCALTSAKLDEGPNLTQLGSLQTVYADMITNVVRLELAVRNLNAEDPLQITLEDLIDLDRKPAKPESAYHALLWLARGLNYAAVFLKTLYSDSSRDSQKVAADVYSKTLQEFHDWSVRSTAMVIIKTVPSLERMNRALLLLGPSTSAQDLTPTPEALAQLQLDIERFVGALDKCLAAIHVSFVRRGLDPVFCVPSSP